MNNEVEKEFVVVGAGLTGLTTAYTLAKAGADVQVLEAQDRVGGQIRTYEENGFIYESGPNTGSISWPEVKELFESLGDSCSLQVADESAKRRLIWKGTQFWALPSSLSTALKTPLFTWYDKFRILGEPFRAKGTNPDETVGELACRRLGKSYVDYAINPFISGVYAGDPMRLVTRYALPKLYRLENEYGSFIKGSIAKAKQPKSDRDKKATKQVFSAQGGLSRLVEALTSFIGMDRITLSAKDITIQPAEEGKWSVQYNDPSGATATVIAKKVITTVGAYALPKMLPFVDESLMSCISNLEYAPVMQVSVGLNDAQDGDFRAFGALVPQLENKKILGVLFPSSCFAGRSPKGGVLMSFFMGGIRHPEMLKMSDEEVKAIIEEVLVDMLKLRPGTHPDVFHVFRHEHAIPQYEKSSGARFEAIEKIESQYPGLVLGGNIRNGIGMADRIRQAVTMANEALKG